MDITNIIKNGGATLNKKGKNITLKSGYQVSTHDIGRINKKELTEKMINDVINYGLKRGEYCGIWIDDGFAYVDISKRISTKKQAINLGKKLNQISIFDWKKQQAVYL